MVQDPLAHALNYKASRPSEMKTKRNKEKIKVVEASNEEVKDDVKIDSILSKENEGSNHLATITTL